jgi:hypothetical protein
MATFARTRMLVLATLLGSCGGGDPKPMQTGHGGARGGSGGAGGAGGSPSADAGRDADSDAALCGCVVSGSTLTVSWDCYCKRWGCNDLQPACEAFRTRTGYSDCDLVTDTVELGGGPWISVFDSSGGLVGSQSTSDTSAYECPSDPSVTGLTLRAGRFPEPSCAGVACPCTDGGTSCP